MTPAALTAPLLSTVFCDDEPVFGSHSHLLPDVAGPAFGDVTEWPANCLPRRSNRSRGRSKVRFPRDDPAWNLRLREVAFAMLNPVHRALRTAEIFLRAEPASLGTVVSVRTGLVTLGRWARDNGLPADLTLWDGDDLKEFIAVQDERVQPPTITNYVEAIRWLHTLAPVLTGGGLREDPWEGQSATKVAHSVRKPVSTPAVPPATWWPMLRCAWTYISVFASDLLDLRDQLRDSDATAELATPRSAVPRQQRLDDMLDEWLAGENNAVPVHAVAWRGAEPGEPLWTTLSLAVTGGGNSRIFELRRSAVSLPRRQRVMAVVATGRVKPAKGYQAAIELGVERAEPNRMPFTARERTEQLRQWLADPANCVPVRASDSYTGAAGTPAWKPLARLVYERPLNDLLSAQYEEGRTRRRMVEEVVAAGRTVPVDGKGTHLHLPIDTAHFAMVTRADGRRGPWRESISRADLDVELRMVRAAIYVFVAALSMMRDSEVQEIERGALTTHYGSSALRSHKVKHDPSSPELYWWIIEPVAEAIAVAARLSWHPTHVFATINPPTGKGRRGRRGIIARQDIENFITYVNAHHEQYGLEEIPAGKVYPHMLRKTMAVITRQEPDGEIALGLQLKHAARRALANRVTEGYGHKDPAWAKEFDDQLELAAATRLVELLRDRQSGADVAVGPGAARLHAGLDKVLDHIEQAQDDPELRAQVMDDRTLALLLREEFPSLHWGTLNHCLWNADTAECQNTLPQELRGSGPLLGMCQPAKCRNSVVIKKLHGRLWLAEENDLKAMLRTKKLSPVRDASLQARLDEVQAVTRSWDEKEAS
jgi:hypothetical protein